MVLSVCFFYAFLAGANGTAYTSGGHAVEAEFNTNPYVYLLGLTSLMICTYSFLIHLVVSGKTSADLGV